MPAACIMKQESFTISNENTYESACIHNLTTVKKFLANYFLFKFYKLFLIYIYIYICVCVCV